MAPCAPAAAGGLPPEVQHIWVFCEDPDQAKDLLDFCRESQRPQVVPEVVAPPDGCDGDKPFWGDSLATLFTQLPPPYRPEDHKAFRSDVDALLRASLASSRLARAKDERLKACLDEGGDRVLRERQGTRWPALLVTDREKLCHVTFPLGLQSAIAGAASLRTCDLLPVVLAMDFRILNGNIRVLTPLAVCASLTLGPEACAGPGGSMAAEHSGTGGGPAGAGSWPATGSAADGWPSRLAPPPLLPGVELKLGVYLQRGQLHDERAGSGCGCAKAPQLFGARCLALFGDGQCAYSAVSPDGVRCVEASGPWEVLNGQVVVGGSSPGTASVSHFRLSQAHAQDIGGGGGVSYQEPVHVALEELESEFDAAIPLDECLPRGGEHLRLSLLGQSCESSGGAGNDADSQLRRGWDGGAPEPPSLLDATFGTTWVSATTAGRPNSATSVRTLPPEPEPDDTLMSTPQHALTRIVRVGTSLSAAAAAAENAEGGRDPKPRLLGLQRGISGNSTGALPGAATPKDASCCDGATRGAAAMKRLSMYASSMPRLEAPTTFARCPLRPGTYGYESGERGEFEHRSFQLILHADGRCKYRETSGRSILQSAPASINVWSVEGSALVLGAREPGTYGFVLTEAAGQRSVQRRVARIEAVVELVLQMSCYTPFPQQVVPFPGHVSIDESQRIFGTIDPDSPVLLGMKCRPDRIPCHAFQHELRQHGLPCDEIISDFHFLDRDKDGQIGVADIRLLETYGNPAAAPEVIHELVDALLHRYGSLACAFEALARNAAQGNVTFAEFERLLGAGGPEPVAAHQTGAKAPRDGGQKIIDWMNKTTAEDRSTLFASLNPTGRPSIDLTDFMSLSLHTAVLSVRRLEHFQSWLFEQFGRTDDVFAKVFRVLDTGQERTLTRSMFVEGAETLGYPCGRQSTRSIFTLLDRNFDGNVSLRNFELLRDFSAESLLMNLEALKRFSEKKFGGVDACFNKLIEREQYQQQNQAARTVSFATFRNTCTQAGFNEMAKDPDLPMLFLFLDVATGKRTDGMLSAAEWSLLKGFNSSALTGSPARLRRILVERYGGMDQAFQQMHTSWLRLALLKGLRQTALASLAHAFCGRSVECEDARPTQSVRNRCLSAGHRRPGSAVLEAQQGAPAWASAGRPGCCSRSPLSPYVGLAPSLPLG